MKRQIYISARIKWCKYGWRIGDFIVNDNTDLRRFAAIKVKKRYEERKHDWPTDWLKRLETVEILDVKDSFKELLVINVKEKDEKNL